MNELDFDTPRFTIKKPAVSKSTASENSDFSIAMLASWRREFISRVLLPVSSEIAIAWL